MITNSDRHLRQAELVPRDRLLLQDATVVGVGAIGRQVAWQLATLGVPKLRLIDFDIVEGVNVATQGYGFDDIGRWKVDATTAACRRVAPEIDIATVRDRFRPAHPIGTALFCCVDSIGTRAAIWRNVERRVLFWADSRMLGETLRVLTASDRRGREEYRATLFPEAEAQQGSCTGRGTIYTAVIAAGLMVHQFVRYLRDEPLDVDATLNLRAGELTVV